MLGHEITHITAKHTVRSIQKRNAVQLGAEQTKGGSLASAAVSQLAGAVYKDLFENKFDRNDEMEADRVGIVLANKVGYSPNALSDVLKALDARNTNAQAAERSVRVAPGHAGAPRRHRQDHQGTEADRDGDGRGALQGTHHLGRQARCRNHDR